ncbi:MAG TPA: FG-GAP repeat protein [Phycisphaerales bacterium]|nr:FG-GAP repeat protein [Phycisphaerales bacterium]
MNRTFTWTAITAATLALAAGTARAQCDSLDVITPSDPELNQNFGNKIATFGTTMVVGAYADDGAAGANQGAVYVHTRTGRFWTQAQKLTAGGNAQMNDYFGKAVDLDGTTIVVGAPGHTVQGHAGAGMVFVFNYTQAAGWNYAFGFPNPDPAANENFGADVAVHGDHMMIGAPGDDEAGVDAGAIYFYRKVNGNWQFVDRLANSNHTWAGMRAGEIIDLHGNTAIAGFPSAFSYGHADNGAVCVWRRQANGHWTRESVIMRNDSRMGTEVAAGPNIIAWSSGVSGTGWVESMRNNTPDDVSIEWGDEPNSLQYHVYDNDPNDQPEHFGASLWIGANNDLLVGATGGRTRAYLFPNAAWQATRRVATIPGAPSLGASVAMAGTTMLVAEPTYANGALTSAGGVRTYNEVSPLNGADRCADAVAITPGTYTGCTASASGDVKYICTNTPTQFSADVYYLIEAESTGLMTLDTAGSNFDTVLAVYNGCEGAMLECNDDAPGLNYQSRVTLLLNKGQTYAVRIAGYNGAIGQFQLNVDQECGTADFNWDGDTGTDQDIEAFFACLGGNCCPTCGSADFNGDGDYGTDQDIEAFFRVLGGGAC